MTWRTPIALVALLLAPAGCWIDDTIAVEVDAGSDGGAKSANNVNGFCFAEPGSCADLTPADESLGEHCCFDNTAYWCEGGEIVWKDCESSCQYESSGDHILCKGIASEEGGGPGPGDWPGTEPSPGGGF